MITASRARESSNQAVDKHGNLIGYMLQDDEGNPFVIGRDGKPMHIQRDAEGKLTVLDDAGNPVALQPASHAPRLVETDDAGNVVVLIDAEGNG